jgi:hypothetical protein
MPVPGNMNKDQAPIQSLKFLPMLVMITDIIIMDTNWSISTNLGSCINRASWNFRIPSAGSFQLLSSTSLERENSTTTLLRLGSFLRFINSFVCEICTIIIRVIFRNMKKATECGFVLRTGSGCDVYSEIHLQRLKKTRKLQLRWPAAGLR